MRPDCFKCIHASHVPSMFIRLKCNNKGAHVIGTSTAVRLGAFKWPDKFDPFALVSCDGFEEKPKPFAGICGVPNCECGE